MALLTATAVTAAADYQKTYGVRIVRLGAPPNAFGELAVHTCSSSAKGGKQLAVWMVAIQNGVCNCLHKGVLPLTLLIVYSPWLPTHFPLKGLSGCLAGLQHLYTCLPYSLHVYRCPVPVPAPNVPSDEPLCALNVQVSATRLHAPLAMPR